MNTAHARKREPITADRLRALLHYCPETGIFTRAVQRTRWQAGTVAGTPDRSGHLQISIEGQIYRAHRLAWLYMTGEWPMGIIDHRDGVPDNNVWSNLREATFSMNVQNQRKANSRSTTGLLGVTYVKRRGNFQAQIGTKAGHKYLGSYPTAEEAHQVYLAAKRRLHEGNML